MGKTTVNSNCELIVAALLRPVILSADVLTTSHENDDVIPVNAGIHELDSRFRGGDRGADFCIKGRPRAHDRISGGNEVV
jgi:hypothetical protein